MRLVKDINLGAYNVQVCCVHEQHMHMDAKRQYPRKSRRFTLAEGYADLDGRPFIDYYCDDCAREYHVGNIIMKDMTHG